MSASFASVPNITIDGSGNIYTFDFGADLVRVISSGTISTVAGTSTAGTPIPGFAGDNGPATSAQVHAPWEGAVANGHLVFSDTFNNAIREVW